MKQNELDRLLDNLPRKKDKAATALKRIREINEFCQALSNAAYAVIREDSSAEDSTWERVYHEVFSEQVSQKVIKKAEVVGRYFEWYDPDTTYREDAEAFISALQRYVREFD